LSAESSAAIPSRYLIVAQLKLSSLQTLAEAIAKLGNSCPVADNAWIVASTYSLATVRNLLRPLVRPAEQLVIVDIARDRATWTGYGPSDEARLRQMWNG
jgi:hypothetical protein